MAAFASSYIKTEGSQVTRSADAASMTGANFSSWFNNAEGTFYNEATAPAINQIILAASDGTNNNRVLIQQGTNNRNLTISVGGVGQASINVAATSGVTTKSSAAYATNSAQLAANGTLGVEDISVSLPVVDRLQIGRSADGTFGYLNGTIRKLSFYPRRLANAEIVGLTS
jgi:hypothetical protein